MKSIRSRLTRDLVAVVVLLLVGGLAALLLVAHDAAYDQFDQVLQAKADTLLALTTRSPDGLRVDPGGAFTRNFGGRRSGDRYQVWDNTGRLVAQSGPILPDAPAPPAARPRKRRGWDMRIRDRDRAWNLPLPDRRPARAMLVVSEDARVVVASEREELDDLLWHMAAASIGWSALLIGATCWVVPRVLRRGLDPVDRLGREAAGMDARRLGARFSEDDLPVELRPIATRLNDLLGRIAQSFERERRFSADLAHELRTPLAELRSLAESAIKWPDDRDAGTDRDTLAIAVQMERIVSHILALARSEEGQMRVMPEPVSVDRLVRDVWQRFAPRASERGIAVAAHFESAEELTDPALLESIVTNLVENAVDYAAPAGRLTLWVGRRNHWTEVSVSNSVTDLSHADVDRLFERFWRKEPARSGGTHVGLGLSLASAFASALGWQLAARLDDNRILTLTLRAPRRDPAAGPDATNEPSSP